MTQSRAGKAKAVRADEDPSVHSELFWVVSEGLARMLMPDSNCAHVAEEFRRGQASVQDVVQAHVNRVTPPLPQPRRIAQLEHAVAVLTGLLWELLENPGPDVDPKYYVRKLKELRDG